MKYESVEEIEFKKKTIRKVKKLNFKTYDEVLSFFHNYEKHLTYKEYCALPGVDANRTASLVWDELQYPTKDVKRIKMYLSVNSKYPKDEGTFAYVAMLGDKIIETYQSDLIKNTDNGLSHLAYVYALKRCKFFKNETIHTNFLILNAGYGVHETHTHARYFKLEAPQYRVIADQVLAAKGDVCGVDCNIKLMSSEKSPIEKFKTKVTFKFPKAKNNIN